MSTLPRPFLVTHGDPGSTLIIGGVLSPCGLPWDKCSICGNY